MEIKKKLKREEKWKYDRTLSVLPLGDNPKWWVVYPPQWNQYFLTGK